MTGSLIVWITAIAGIIVMKKREPNRKIVTAKWESDEVQKNLI